MFYGRSLSRLAATPALLACGVAGVLALAACGSGSSSSAASSASSHSSAAASAAPSWAAVLGKGVTVIAPRSVSPGHASPGAVVAGLYAAITAKQPLKVCDYAEPSYQAACRSQLGKASAGQMPSITNFAIGYTAIDGHKAVVGITGKSCVPGAPKCTSNSNPAAVFATAKSFSALWSSAIKTTVAYSLTPCIEIGGKWYVYGSS